MANQRAQANASPSDALFDQALLEYFHMVDGGEPVDDEQFIADHPQVADQLRDFLAIEGQVHRMAGARVEETSAIRRAAGDTQDRSPKAAQKAAIQDPMPQRFGRYVIRKTLGKGGMGVVYLAEDTELHRLVALKIPTLTDDDPERSAERLSRFFREARAAATLRHAHICPVYDVGQIDGRHYISMAYIEGTTLLHIIKKQGPQPEPAAALLVRKLAVGLAEAHAAGVVHRDLKPSNVMVDRKGEPVITDFGLARQMATSDDSRLTQSGVVMGSPAYMSPEQVEGDEIGPASDIYSLGVILFETLTGRVPFAGSPMQVMKKVAHDDPPRPSELRAGLDPRLEAICLRMMAKTPGQRHSSMDEVAAALGDYLKGLNAPPRPAPREVAPPPIAQRLPTTGRNAPIPEAVAEPALPSFAPSAGPRPMAQRTAAARRKNRLAWLVGGGVAGLGLLGLLAAAAIVLLIQTDPKTTVRIEYDDPDAVAFIDGGKIRIENIGQPVEIEPGEHTLTIKRGDVVVKTDHFAIERGERRVLDITLPKAEVAARETAAKPSRTDLAMGGSTIVKEEPMFPAIGSAPETQISDRHKPPLQGQGGGYGGGGFAGGGYGGGGAIGGGARPALQEPDDQSAQTPAAMPKPPLLGKVGGGLFLTVTNVSAETLVDGVAKQLKRNLVVHPSSGERLKQRVTLEAKGVTLQQWLQLVLDDVGLTADIDDDTITVRAKP